MSYTHVDMLLRLIAVHVIADFMLQSDRWVANRATYKIKSRFLYLHTLIIGVLTYVAFGVPGAFLIPIIITVSHFGLDVGKAYIKRDNITIFLLDQALHLLVIVICWLAYTRQFQIAYNQI